MVVFFSFFRIVQYFIGLIQFLEFAFTFDFVFGHIRMIFTRQFPIRLAKHIIIRIARNS